MLRGAQVQDGLGRRFDRRLRPQAPHPFEHQLLRSVLACKTGVGAHALGIGGDRVQDLAWRVGHGLLSGSSKLRHAVPAP